MKNGIPLPDGICLDTDDGTNKFFSLVQHKGYTDAEVNTMLQIEMIRKTNTIKNCAVFFTVLTIISMFCAILFALNALL